MTIIQLCYKIIQVLVEVEVRLILVNINTTEFEYISRTAYFVELILAISARILEVDSWNGGGESR